MKKGFIIIIGLILFLSAGCNNTSGDYTVDGIVFLDENNNGTMEDNESGIKNITINYDEGNVTTNSNGEYTINTNLSSIKIEVDESTLNINYILTTNNNVQTVNTNQEAEPIGYASLVTENADPDNLLFKDVVMSNNITNYYFEAIMENGSMETTFKLWVMDNSMKLEDPMQTVFVNSSQGIMGMYLASTNQVIITPMTEPINIDTPFSLVSDLDAETFDMINYTGTETLDDKKVYVFENTVPGFEAKYYVWADKGIIIKMIANYGDMTNSLYFKDLTIGNVTEADFQYPSGAEIIDVSSF